MPNDSVLIIAGSFHVNGSLCTEVNQVIAFISQSIVFCSRRLALPAIVRFVRFTGFTPFTSFSAKNNDRTSIKIIRQAASPGLFFRSPTLVSLFHKGQQRSNISINRTLALQPEISVDALSPPSIKTTMRKPILTALTLIATFYLGYAFNALSNTTGAKQPPFKRVTGIGGIFFKCKDPGKVREWYKTHIGLKTNQYGSVFEWRQGADTTKKGFTQWSPFSEKTTYFAPSTKDFMINYRVENLKALVEQLKKEGVVVTDTIEAADYGKFVHILDVEGNKVELWEPNDIEYERLGKKMGSITTM